MGGEHRVLGVEQGGLRGKRGLLVEHVDASPGQLPLVQRLGQSHVVHDGAPGHVDENGRGLHHRQALAGEQPLGLPIAGHVEGDDVALLQQLL